MEKPLPSTLKISKTLQAAFDDKDVPAGLWKQHLIENQSRYPTNHGSYGWLGNLSANGCGLMAVCNLNNLMGKETAFQDLLREFYLYDKRRLGSSKVLFGLLGTNPFVIAAYYKKLGYRVRRYYKTAKIAKDHDGYILLYIFKDEGFPWVGAHYVAANYDKQQGNYRLYNDGYRQRIEDFSLMFKPEDHAKILLVYGIDKVKERGKDE